MTVRDGGKIVDKSLKIVVASLAVVVVGFGISRGISAQGADAARPVVSQRSGNTWCGITSTAGNDQQRFLKDLATYVDNGAQIVGFTEDDKADQTVLLCGPMVRPAR